MSRLLPSKRDKSDSFGQPKCLKYETCHSVTLVSLKKADSLYGARTRVSECVNIPAGERKQMNFCLWIFYRIFYPFKSDKSDKSDKCGSSRGWSVSLCLPCHACHGFHGLERG